MVTDSNVWQMAANRAIESDMCHVRRLCAVALVSLAPVACISLTSGPVQGLPGATPMKPGAATLPMFGVVPVILDSEGNELTETESAGYLAIKKSWPGQMRTIYGDHDRFESTYFTLLNAENRLICDRFYITGDGCRRDKDGYYWLTGRVDDVINVSGHRIGTAEIESKLDEHPLCAGMYACMCGNREHAWQACLCAEYMYACMRVRMYACMETEIKHDEHRMSPLLFMRIHIYMHGTRVFMHVRRYTANLTSIPGAQKLPSLVIHTRSKARPSMRMLF